MGSLDQCRHDKQRDQEGFWVSGEDIGLESNPDGTFPEFLIRSTYRTNTGFERAKERWMRKHAKGKSSWDLPDYQAIQMSQYGFAEACLLGWRNVLDDDSNPVQFRRELRHDYTEEYPKLFDKLLKIAQDENISEGEVVERLAGESSSTSSSKSSGEA